MVRWACLRTHRSDRGEALEGSVSPEGRAASQADVQSSQEGCPSEQLVLPTLTAAVAAPRRSEEGWDEQAMMALASAWEAAVAPKQAEGMLQQAWAQTQGQAQAQGPMEEAGGSPELQGAEVEPLDGHSGCVREQHALG